MHYTFKVLFSLIKKENKIHNAMQHPNQGLITFQLTQKKSPADCVGPVEELFRNIHWTRASSVLFGLSAKPNKWPSKLPEELDQMCALSYTAVWEHTI